MKGKKRRKKTETSDSSVLLHLVPPNTFPPDAHIIISPEQWVALKNLKEFKKIED